VWTCEEGLWGQEERLAVQLSNEDSWDRMLTYERWLAGERMADMWLELAS